MKKIINTFILGVTVWGLSSCLKDKNVNLSPDGSPAVVEFSTSGGDGNVADLPVATRAGYTLYTRAYSVGANNVVPVVINYTGGEAAPEDITVNLGVNTAALTAYNNATTPAGTLVALPAANYTLPATVVIPKGARKAVANVIFNNSTFTTADFGRSYVLPIAITGASNNVQVSCNYGTVLYQLGTKNTYDGVYTMKGFILRENDAVLSGNFRNISRSLVTTGPNSVTFSQVWKDGSAVGGIDGTTITVNPTTNKVTMSSTANPALVNLPSYDNRYDPATKTFYISFYWGSGPNNRATTDTLVYTGTRP